MSDTTRPRTRAGTTSRSLVADLEALGWKLDYRQSSRIALTLEALVGELAALATMADGVSGAPLDREGRSGVLAHQMPIPSFDAPAAYRALYEAEQRLYREYERLTGVVKQPQGQKCESCGRKVRVVDVYCGPCGARILREHRRSNSRTDSVNSV